MEKYILIIEDNKAVVDSLVWLLKDYKVISVNNGYDAHKLLERGTLPVVILLDLMMPIMDGFAFRQTQSANPRLNKIPTIIMSARCNIERIVEKMPNEIILTKPLDIKKLLHHIKNHYDS